MIGIARQEMLLLVVRDAYQLRLIPLKIQTLIIFHDNICALFCSIKTGNSFINRIDLLIQLPIENLNLIPRDVVFS